MTLCEKRQESPFLHLFPAAIYLHGLALGFCLRGMLCPRWVDIVDDGGVKCKKRSLWCRMGVVEEILINEKKQASFLKRKKLTFSFWRFQGN